MIFDLNMWKNQIFYQPKYYGQYTGVLTKLAKIMQIRSKIKILMATVSSTTSF